MAQTSGRTGFTLIEVMVALVVVAITTSYALASYRKHLLRSHRIEAVQGLLAAAAEQEKFHLTQGRYSDRLDAAAGDDPPGLRVASLTHGQRYRMAVAFADAATFRIVATPEPGGGQMDDRDCRLLWIDQSGQRQARDAVGNDSTGRCW
jgi:type IV pilus assembly protein PilE